MLKEAQFLKVNTSGNIIEMGISEESFMRDYAEFFCEWLDGTVIKLSPINTKHDELTRYLSCLIDAYLEQKPLGELRQEPHANLYEWCSGYCYRSGFTRKPNP